jgi:hypothetical protein
MTKKFTLSILALSITMGCGLDNCLYKTECVESSPTAASCVNLSTLKVKRYTEEAMNAMDKENYTHAIKLLDCLISNDSSIYQNYARRGLAYAGKTGRFSPIDIITNITKPTYLDELKTELTALAPSSVEDSVTYYDIGQDLRKASKDLLTAISIIPDPSQYNTLKWLAILYSGISSSYTLNSQRLLSAPNTLNSQIAELIRAGQGAEVAATLLEAKDLATLYSTDPDTTSVGLAAATAGILVAINYPTYLISVASSDENEGLIAFLQL